jgi:hypothetical protein
MSENSFPFEPAPEAAPFETDEDTGSRKSTLVVGGLLASLLLGGGGFFLLNSGGDAEEDFAVPVRQPQAAAPVEGEVAPVEVVPVASTEQFGRNPFKALYVVPKGAVDGGAAPSGTQSAQLTTPKEIIEQSKPAPAAPAPVTQTAPAPAPAPASEPEPTKPVDDGLRYPVTLMSLDAEVDGVTGLIQWGYDGNFLHVQPGVNWGRFTHLRVMQVVQTEEREGVMLQWGDGSPYFVALGETVYVL